MRQTVREQERERERERKKERLPERKEVEVESIQFSQTQKKNIFKGFKF